MARRRLHTYNFALKLAETHDFVILTETRETENRRQYILQSLPEEFVYFSSGIGARKGGIAIIIKRCFLAKFSVCTWKVMEDGRVASLTLRGNTGTLNIIPVYLDPTSGDAQINGVNCISGCLAPNAHNLVAGDWNFVEHAADRITNASADTAKTHDPRSANAWRNVAQQMGFSEFEQTGFTCENSHGWSRIDRIYSDLHKASWLNVTSHCSTLEHPRHWSDHCPISFGARHNKKDKRDSVPSWVASHEQVESEVAVSLKYLWIQYIEDSKWLRPSTCRRIVVAKTCHQRGFQSYSSCGSASGSCDHFA